jgi:nitroreductase
MHKKNDSKLLEIIRKRRSVRSFSGKPIESENLKLILEAARLAPSSCNSQPWHFVVVDKKDLIKKIAVAQPKGTPINKFLKKAAIIIACVEEPKLIVHKAAGLLNRDNHRIDIGIAVEHMVLVATELGIGSCWIGWFSEEKIKKLLKIPKNKSVSAMLALGFPTGKTDENGMGGIKPRSRKSLKEIASKNAYRNDIDIP